MRRWNTLVGVNKQQKLLCCICYIICMLILVHLQGCAIGKRQEKVNKALNKERVVNDENRFDENRTKTHGSFGKNSVYQVGNVVYKPLYSATGFQEEGVAAWYGEDFKEKQTASGEPLDAFKLRASHRTLPIGSWVKVSNLETKRSTLLKVNDRGPFIDGRIIDVSFKAAQKLGAYSQGTIKVLVEGLDSTAFPELEGRNTIGVFLYLRVADNYHSAQMLRRSLLANNTLSVLESNRNLIVDVVPGKNREYPYSVRIGPFKNPWQLEVMLEQLNDSGYDIPVFEK